MYVFCPLKLLRTGTNLVQFEVQTTQKKQTTNGFTVFT